MQGQECLMWPHPPDCCAAESCAGPCLPWQHTRAGARSRPNPVSLCKPVPANRQSTNGPVQLLLCKASISSPIKTTLLAGVPAPADTLSSSSWSPVLEVMLTKKHDNSCCQLWPLRTAMPFHEAMHCADFDIGEPLAPQASALREPQHADLPAPPCQLKNCPQQTTLHVQVCCHP